MSMRITTECQPHQLTEMEHDGANFTLEVCKPCVDKGIANMACHFPCKHHHGECNICGDVADVSEVRCMPVNR